MISRSTAVPGVTVILTGPHGTSRRALHYSIEELELSADSTPDDPIDQG
ncbi:MAG: hypothetical protein AAGC93_29975 [Cyanobacteria bacterium P01_F01_bin.53]